MSVVAENAPTRAAVARFWMCTYFPAQGMRVMCLPAACPEPGESIRHVQYDMSKLDPLCNWPTVRVGEGEECNALVYQMEVCPDTGREHIQLYAEFSKPCRFSHVQSVLNITGAHCESRKKSREACVAYCTKGETRKADTVPVLLGTVASNPEGTYKTRQGKRTDISAMVDSIKSGKRALDVMEADPDTYVKYHRGMTTVRELYQRAAAKKDRDLTVEVHWGVPGAGKTKHVYDRHGFENVFTVVACSDNVWFDGYEGEDVLLIDDFNGWIKYSFLLKLLDRYPLRLPIKGAFTYAQWTKVYITSNYPVDEWYKDATLDLGALKRRITTIKHYGRVHAAAASAGAGGSGTPMRPLPRAPGFTPAHALSRDTMHTPLALRTTYDSDASDPESSGEEEGSVEEA